MHGTADLVGLGFGASSPIRTFKRSKDPAVAHKLVEIVGLTMDPLENSIALAIDEKSQIHALDRTQPGLPVKPGKAATMTHDTKRHGTTTLFAALEITTGKVISQNLAHATAVRSSSACLEHGQPVDPAGSAGPRSAG